MIYRIFMVSIFALFFTVMYFIGKEKGRRLGVKEGIEAVKIVHNEAVKADSDYCKEKMAALFKEIDGCIDYIEEQLDEVPDCFDALKRDIEHLKSQTLAESVEGDDEELFDFSCEDDERDFIGGEIVEPKVERAAPQVEVYDCKECSFVRTPYCEQCRSIVLGGIEEKPSRFVKVGEKVSGENGAHIISAVSRGEAFPISLAVKYNLSVRRNG